MVEQDRQKYKPRQMTIDKSQHNTLFQRNTTLSNVEYEPKHSETVRHPSSPPPLPPRIPGVMELEKMKLTIDKERSHSTIFRDSSQSSKACESKPPLDDKVPYCSSNYFGQSTASPLIEKGERNQEMICDDVPSMTVMTQFNDNTTQDPQPNLLASNNSSNSYVYIYLPVIYWPVVNY